jgi:hypothetical protein
MTWEIELKNYDKFMNYNGCELVMMLPILYQNQPSYHVSGYVRYENSIPQIHGIGPKIFELTKHYHNYTVRFEGVEFEQDWQSAKQHTEIISINDSNVYFEILPINNAHPGVLPTNVVNNFHASMFVTPAEKYTQYEKFFLPFDLHTWILVSITFLVTFVSIIIINRFSKSVRSLFYGQNVDTPIWNVISIFFGISQTKLPTKNFSRFILVLFIYFCLIFRTCFQSKFFEFMTSEPRKSPPKTIEDLIERNYVIYTTSLNEEFCNNAFRFKEW